jgi:O-antigen/teichoic acid export membrane protein
VSPTGVPGRGDATTKVGRADGRRRGSVVRLASTTYLATVFGIVTGPIIARVLGAEGRGEYAAVMIYSSTAMAILSLGMGFTVNHSLLILREDPRVVFGNILRFSGIILIPSLLMAVAVLPVVSEFTDVARIGAFVFIALTPLAVLQICLNSFLISEGALGPLTLVRVLPLFLNVVGVVTLALFGALTVASYLALTLVGSIGTLAFAVYAVRMRPMAGGRLGPQLRFGLRAYPGSLAGVGNSQLDQLLVAPLLGARDLGYYAIAVTLANLPLGVVQALSARSIRDIAKSDGTLDVDRASQNLRQALALALIAAAGLAILVPVLVPVLYGHSFAPVVGLCFLLLPGTVAVTASTLAGPALTLAGRPGTASLAQLVALGVTVAGLAITLPILGVAGAAITTVIAYWVRAGIQLWALRRSGVIGLFPNLRDMRDVVALLVRRLTQPVRSVGWMSRRR